MKKMLLFMSLITYLSLISAPVRAEEGAGAPLTPSSGAEEIAERKPARPLPFRSVIYSIDEEHRAYFHMGKHKLRKVYITPTTRFLLASGEIATVADLRIGADVRGSYRQRPDQHYDAVTIKIGTKERDQ